MPPAPTTAGQEVVDLAESVGLILDPPQADVLHGGLGQHEDGQWFASEVGVVEPRQNGKGCILEARALGGLYLFNEPLILWTAHEFKTSREGFLRVRALVDNYDHLRKRVKAVRMAAGEEGVELLNGCRLRFIARSGGSGRGFSGDCVFLDEAYALTDDQMAALMPTLSARPNVQIWYTSSAPLEASVVLRRVCKRGRVKAPGLAYFEWCADKSSKSDDPVAWAAANPALGIRITEEAIRRELGSMGEDEFRRERLGIWVEDADQGGLPVASWRDSVDIDSQVQGKVVFALDANPERTAAAIAVCGLRADELEHGEITDHRPSLGWVVDRVLELKGRWGEPTFLLDPSGPAGSLIAPLQEAGIEPVLVSGREMAQACGAFHDAVLEGRFRHLDQDSLNVAVAGARRRALGDSWAWHRQNSQVDICPLVAVTLARYGFALYGRDEEEVEPWAMFD